MIIFLAISAIGFLTSLILWRLKKRAALGGVIFFLYVLSLHVWLAADYYFQFSSHLLLFSSPFRFSPLEEKAAVLLTWGVPSLPPLFFLWWAERRAALFSSIVLLMILGGMSLLGGFFLFQERRDYLKHAHAVEGTITGYERADQAEIYYPAVELKNDRVMGILLYRYGGNPPSLRIGSTYRILCAPDCSGDALMDTWKDKWGSVLCLVILGTALLGAGIGCHTDGVDGVSDGVSRLDI